MIATTNYDEVLEKLLAARDHQASVVRLELNTLRKIEDAVSAVSKILDPNEQTGSEEKLSINADAIQRQTAGGGLDNALPDLVLEVACRRKSIADAAIAVLALMAEPISETDILTYLIRGNLTFNTNERLGALRAALHRKEKHTKSILQISKGVWGLTAWKEVTNPDQIGFGPANTRDKAAHADATMKGLQAARAEGRKGGRIPKITADHASFILQRLKERCSVAKIAAELGVSPIGLGKAIRRLRDEGHLPQKLSSIYEATKPNVSRIEEDSSGDKSGEPILERQETKLPNLPT